MKISRKVLAVWLSVLMCVSLLAASATTTVSAAQEETILLACSDFQPGSLTTGKSNISAILAAMKADGITKADYLFTVGDYNTSTPYDDPTSIPDSRKGIAALKEVFSPVVGDNMLFVQGNHDMAAVEGLVKSGNNDPAYGAYGLYVVNEDSFREWGSVDAAALTDLQLYLKNKVEIGYSKPIFILNHVPLHWSNRTIKDSSGLNAYKVFNIVNDAAAQGLNIIYMFGHNHSSGYDDFLGGSSIFLKKGDTIEICQGSKTNYKSETLNFTYMNAGYVGNYKSDATDAEKDLTISVFRIRGNEVIISRYSKDGVYNLKSAGTENTSFGYSVNPTVNTTVYAGTYKIAADGTATAVDTHYEMSDTNGRFTSAETSISEEVSGLAFKFDITASGMQVEDTTAIYDDAKVNVMDGNYKLVRMGAVVTNKTNIGTDGSAFYLDAVDGKGTIDIPAVYLFDWSDEAVSFAVRIRNIPENRYDAAIYARPYYVFDYNGTEITVYGDIVGASYNGKLSNNDGMLEW